MKREPPSIDAMLWIPGQGPDEMLLRDLAARFHKPGEPLGEAWFMGGTRYLYDELNAGGIEAVDNEYLSGAFDEAVGGMSSFFEMNTWAEWYAYLTPRILLSGRFLEHPSLIDTMWDGLISLSWYSQAAYVRRYEDSLARVLAPLMMHPSFWRNGKYHDPYGAHIGAESWGEWELSSHFATSMLLSLRYLHPSGIEPWLRSVLAIEDTQWRAQFLLWVQQVASIFAQDNASLEVLSRLNIESLWPGSYRWLISMKYDHKNANFELIPRHNIAALYAAITRYFDETTYFAWIDAFAAQTEIWPQIELSLEKLPQVLAQMRG